MNRLFLDACAGKRTDHRPVWFMRQAGRSLPEYRARRGDGSILDAIRQPDLAAELTLQPIRRYGVDAAILYSDIMVPVYAIDFGVDIAPGIGPVVHRPFRSVDDLSRLRNLEPESDCPYVAETIGKVTAELDVPLIGFAGAPFTVASYLVEGKPTRTWAKTKQLMYSDPQLWARLTDRLADLAIASLKLQLDSGASAFQLFDSWAGVLSRHEYEKFVFPATQKIFAAMAQYEAPGIHFGVGTGELLDLMAQAGADVVGIDWRVPLERAWERVGTNHAIQGNLDPTVCLAGWDATRCVAQKILASTEGRPGHIFNLGHGVLPETDPDVLSRLTEFVHEWGA